MPNRPLLLDLHQWLADPDVEAFPLDAVVAEYRRVGKHFVDAELLDALAAARAALPADADPLRRFLDRALDKHDECYDNPSYLALHDLPLPTTAGRCPLDTADAERQRDRLIALLIADQLRFEIAAHDGTTALLSLMRPGPRTTAKRCALGLRVLRTAMARLGLDPGDDAGDPVETARAICARLEATAEERRMLAVTMLPVHTAHDEHLFIRTMQCYEATFALVVVQLRAAIIAAHAGAAARVIPALHGAARAMHEAAPLFSLVATMLPEAFMAFGRFTDGASAIQSRSYKTIESLCRKPDFERLAGPGYEAVPDVRARARGGWLTFEDALAHGRFPPRELTEIHTAMQALDAEMLAWRRTHHGLAMRVLGMKRGAAYTAGVPYLTETMDAPLFACPFAGAAHRESKRAGVMSYRGSLIAARRAAQVLQ